MTEIERPAYSFGAAGKAERELSDLGEEVVRAVIEVALAVLSELEQRLDAELARLKAKN